MLLAGVVLVAQGKARFVSDCASYIQSCMKPATDIFINGQEMVASIVVLPLICDGTSFGGFYFTLETASNFQNIKVGRARALGRAGRA